MTYNANIEKPDCVRPLAIRAMSSHRPYRPALGTLVTAFSYQVDYTIVANVQQVSVGGQALPDNQAKPELQNALLLGIE
ncbi:MAG: hypothetical protein EPN89_06100 [Methylovulum sp.]|nr:MAG: hypothetical protein EPN89_06100 [Methylovulum sp.]